MSDSPKEFMDAMVKAVVGIEIHITRLIGKSKPQSEQGGARYPGRFPLNVSKHYKRWPEHREPGLISKMRQAG
jgi:transcriptional regulator